MDMNFSRNRLCSLVEEGQSFEYGNYNVPPPAVPVKRPLLSLTKKTETLNEHLKLNEGCYNAPRSVMSGSNGDCTMSDVITELNKKFSSRARQQTYNLPPASTADITGGTTTTTFGTARAIPAGSPDVRYAEIIKRQVDPTAQSLEELRRILNMLVIDVQSQNKKIEEIRRACVGRGEGGIKPNTIGKGKGPLSSTSALPSILHSSSLTESPLSVDKSTLTTQPLASCPCEEQFPSSFIMRYIVNNKTKENLLKEKKVSFRRFEEQSSPLVTAMPPRPSSLPPQPPPPPQIFKRRRSVRQFLCCF